MTQTKKITFSALFLALGIVLPFVTGQIPEIGSVLLPMHYPAFLCGFIVGPVYGALVGFITPLLRSFLFQMPPILTAVTMAFELTAYGFFTGIFYRSFKKDITGIYLTLILSMLLGRVVWGLASAVIYGEMTLVAFIAGGFTNAIVGIIFQIIIIPILIKSLEKANLIK